MKRLIVTIFIFNCVVILPGVPESQGATLLGESDHSMRGGANPHGHPVDGWLFPVSVSTRNLDPHESALIGLDHLWTEPGQVLLTPQSEPQWDDFVAILTNGNDDGFMSYSFLVSGGEVIGGHLSGTAESRSFGREPDFYGYMIEYMTLDVTYLYYDYTGTLEADLLLSVYGIPEPATIFLLGLGAVIVKKKR